MTHATPRRTDDARTDDARTDDARTDDDADDDAASDDALDAGAGVLGRLPLAPVELAALPLGDDAAPEEPEEAALLALRREGEVPVPARVDDGDALPRANDEQMSLRLRPRAKR